MDIIITQSISDFPFKLEYWLSRRRSLNVITKTKTNALMVTSMHQAEELWNRTKKKMFYFLPVKKMKSAIFIFHRYVYYHSGRVVAKCAYSEPTWRLSIKWWYGFMVINKISFDKNLVNSSLFLGVIKWEKAIFCFSLNEHWFLYLTK